MSDFTDFFRIRQDTEFWIGKRFRISKRAIHLGKIEAAFMFAFIRDIFNKIIVSSRKQLELGQRKLNVRIFDFHVLIHE